MQNDCFFRKIFSPSQRHPEQIGGENFAYVSRPCSVLSYPELAIRDVIKRSNDRSVFRVSQCHFSFILTFWTTFRQNLGVAFLEVLIIRSRFNHLRTFNVSTLSSISTGESACVANVRLGSMYIAN